MHSIFIEKTYWTKMLLLQKCNLAHTIFYVVDGIQYNSSNNTTIQFNCNSMATDVRLNIYTLINELDHKISSVSTVFPSTNWLERELSEFTNVFFYNSPDTRRLLLDYFQNKREVYTYSSKGNSYSSVYYDVVFNY